MGKLLEKSAKGKKQKRIRPNGPRIRNLQVKISLSPNFGAERTLIDPISVTSKFHIFNVLLGFKLISSINNNIKNRPA